MNKEQAVSYLRFSGFSDEQIRTIEGAFTCDKCVYSTSEGCQYDDITETIPPFEDCISRQAVLKIIDGWYDNNRDTENIEDLIVLIIYMSSVNPQKPRLIDPAYEKMLNKWIGAEVLDKIRNEMHATAEKHEDGVYYLRDEWVDEIIDKYAEGSGE